MENLQDSQHKHWHPYIGEIYRDNSDRSLVILNSDDHHAVVEFADGSIKRLNLEEWQKMNPEPALF